MLIRLDVPLKINLELATLIFFAAIGYAFLIKINFYSTLGVSWFAGNLTPSYLFFSSVSYVIAGCLGGVLGWFLLTLKNKSWWKYLLSFLILILICMAIVILSLTNWLYATLGIYTKYISWTFYILLTAYYVFNSLFQLQYADNNRLNFGIIFMIISAYVIVPSLSGSLEARALLKNPSYITSMIKIKDDTNNWYLIDYVNDKAIIMQGNKTQVFKIIEYKDIVQIDNSLVQVK
ncbi:hypothetical protein [Acinetobacter sp. CE-15]|uniref:hypothetical protein n=1 Tax=Acinetobacter sp. CE-15 TaxID=3425693 RepID=UPI003DA3F916